MLYVTIEPVEKPEAFNELPFSEVQWKEANKRGALTVPHNTAMENIRLSGGIYRVRPEATPEIKLAPLPEVEKMTGAQLAQEMASWGRPPRKKMTKAAAQDFVRKLREEGVANIIVDEE